MVMAISPILFLMTRLEEEDEDNHYDDDDDNDDDDLTSTLSSVQS